MVPTGDAYFVTRLRLKVTQFCIPPLGALTCLDSHFRNLVRVRVRLGRRPAVHPLSKLNHRPGIRRVRWIHHDKPPVQSTEMSHTFDLDGTPPRLGQLASFRWAYGEPCSCSIQVCAMVKPRSMACDIHQPSQRDGVDPSPRLLAYQELPSTKTRGHLGIVILPISGTGEDHEPMKPAL